MTEKENMRPRVGTRDMAYIALFAVLMTVCAWISIPLPVPFTLQTFAVFAALGLLGGKRGTLAVLVYILLGAVGLPVFAGFRGGIGALFGATGGYILGFLGSALLYWLLTARLGDRLPVMALSMLGGLLLCYAFGTAWFVQVYTGEAGKMGYIGALGVCVVPFILPDLLKLGLALLLTRRLSGRVPA
ncbi:MAG: biotin transporter BioY [Oscillospiraceae bacterium]